MALYERISLVVSMVLLGLLAFLFVDLPTRTAQFTVLGSPLTLTISGLWLMAVLLGGLAGTGTRAVLHSHPNYSDKRQNSSFAHWTLPALLATLVTLLLPWASIGVLWWIACILVTGVVMWFAILAEYRSLDPDDRWYRLAHAWLNLECYGVAMGFFFIIFQGRARSLISATAVFLVTVLLVTSQLRASEGKNNGSGLYAAVIALILAECTWALNHWRTPTLTASLWLLLLYYLFTGLAQQKVVGRLTRRAVLEYAGVTMAGLAVILVLVP